MNQELLEKCKNADLLKEVAEGKEVVWINENLKKLRMQWQKSISQWRILMMQRQDWRVLHLS